MGGQALIDSVYMCLCVDGCDGISESVWVWPP